jgi:hypothetical protein
MVAAVLALEHGTLDLDRRVFLGPSGEARLSTIESRLLAHLSAHPGKTFTREALQVEVWGYRAGIPSRTVFTTVGRIRQKIEADPSRPRHLLSTDGGYCFVAPEARAPRSALPHPVTPFVGRERELSQLLALLERGARLVSVLGPGGIGKTRVAIECARRFGAALGGGAAFLALEPIEHASALVRAVIEALALRPLSPREEPVAGLVERLRDREQLLLCDNVEQIEGAAALFAALAAGCPALRILATSRARLSLRAETALSLAPLGDPGSGAELERTDAGLLVLDRARRARPGWEPCAAERDALAELCALAEGSPLAIELATAWLRLLDPAEVVRELRAGVDLLRTSDADVPPRHTSVRAMLASSFRLLAPESERALGGLATMRAPFSRDDRARRGPRRSARARPAGRRVDDSAGRRRQVRVSPRGARRGPHRLTATERAGFDRAHAACFLDRLTESYLERRRTRARVAATRGARPPRHAGGLRRRVAAPRARPAQRGRRAALPLLGRPQPLRRAGSSWGLAKRELRTLEPSPERDRALGRLLALEQGAGWLRDEGHDFVAMLEPLGGEDLVVGLIGASIRAQIAGQFALAAAHGQRALELVAEGSRGWLIGFALSVTASADGARGAARARREHAREGRRTGRTARGQGLLSTARAPRRGALADGRDGDGGRRARPRARRLSRCRRSFVRAALAEPAGRRERGLGRRRHGASRRGRRRGLRAPHPALLVGWGPARPV